MYKGELSLEVPYVRYIGKYAFQDCINLKKLDFSKKEDDFIPILSDITAFMKTDKETWVNNSFEIVVPQRLEEKWKISPNWVVIAKNIKGA